MNFNYYLITLIPYVLLNLKSFFYHLHDNHHKYPKTNFSTGFCFSIVDRLFNTYIKAYVQLMHLSWLMDLLLAYIKAYLQLMHIYGLYLLSPLPTTPQILL